MVTTAVRRPPQSPEEVARRIRSRHLRLVPAATTPHCTTGLSTARRAGYSPLLRAVPSARDPRTAAAGEPGTPGPQSLSAVRPLPVNVGPALRRVLAREAADPDSPDGGQVLRSALRPQSAEWRASRPTVVRRPMAPALRITRRGRLCLTVAAFAVVAAAVLSALLPVAQNWLAGQAVSTSVASPQVEEITVLPGQTLWGIAETHRPGRDPRDVAADIRALNHLQDSRVRAGQELLLPAA